MSAGTGVGPLDDIRVVDLTRFLSGPFAGALLADLGADVLRIVKPGEGASGSGPLTATEAFDWATNRGKRELEVDLSDPAGVATVLDLVSRADIVINNFRPGSMERLGLGYDALTAANPRIIACDITGWGLTGPYARAASFDLIAQAASGSIDITGPYDDPAKPPVRWGVPFGDLAAGLFATIGLLAALRVRDDHGVGQRVSVSMLDCLLAISTYRLPQSLDAGLSSRSLQHMGGAGTNPYGPYRCSDGRWIAVGFAKPHWIAACNVMGAQDLLEDPRFETEHTRNRNADALHVRMTEIIATRTSDEWEAAFIAAGAPAGKVNTIRETLRHPQLVARGMVVEIVDDAGRVGHVAADPMGFQSSLHPPIRIGDLDSVGWGDRETLAHRSLGQGATTNKPLEGTRVIEMDGNEPSKTLAGQILADLGADVLLIERPEPVRTRDDAAPADEFDLTDAFRWGMHRGKRGITLNLKSDEDRARFLDMVADVDILYDNFRPGVKDRLKINREDLIARRPDLVTCSATGFGSTGPWAAAAAYDVTLQALSGSMSITGNGGADDEPVRWGHPVGGLAGGLYGAIAVLAALRDVSRGRTSRHIDLSLFDIQAALHTYRIPQTLDVGMEFGPAPRAGGSGARPYGVYPTADGRWFAAGITEQFWVGFCEGAGRPELATDARFAEDADRTRNADELEIVVEALFRSKTAQEWSDIFLERGLPGSTVLTLEEAFVHPQATLNHMLRALPAGHGRTVHVSGFPVQFSASTTGNWTPPPGWQE
ncbi:CoA transferase [Microbacterium sp. BWT-B31]|uniref:CaiB/BaiF CoA transferase family protein n=1 Tax=Microbacterium sp. BWT-B31 TaxID=3232072 RepID=UPI0035292581